MSNDNLVPLAIVEEFQQRAAEDTEYPLCLPPIQCYTSMQTRFIAHAFEMKPADMPMKTFQTIAELAYLATAPGQQNILMRVMSGLAAGSQEMILFMNLVYIAREMRKQQFAMAPVVSYASTAPSLPVPPNRPQKRKHEEEEKEEEKIPKKPFENLFRDDWQQIADQELDDAMEKLAEYASNPTSVSTDCDFLFAGNQI